jgi:RimJ/RimL family protein N-acetyltransferase
MTAASDAEIWAGHPEPDRYLPEVFRRYFDSGLASGTAFVIEDIATGEAIGSTRYHGYDPVLREIEIGWTFLVRRCWGGACNFEVKTLLVTHALTFVDTVVFWVGETNIRSQRAMERIGALRRPGLSTRPDGSAPHVVYELRRPPLRAAHETASRMADGLTQA